MNGAEGKKVQFTTENAKKRGESKVSYECERKKGSLGLTRERAFKRLKKEVERRSDFTEEGKTGKGLIKKNHEGEMGIMEGSFGPKTEGDELAPF